MLRILSAVFALSAFSPALAQFTDPEDGALDASEFIIDKKGFLPIPILITEPAVGYGGGLGLMFVRNSLRERAAEGKETGHVTPPDVFGVAAAATENGTKFAAAGGMFSFGDDDRWRYRGGIAKVDANLDFYGTGGALGNGDRSIGFNLAGWASSQQALLRLGDSSNFLALRWIYLDLRVTFDPTRALPNRAPLERTLTSSGIGPSLEHDSRDNIFTPSRGWQGSLDALFYSPELSSDNKFQTYRAHAFLFQPLGQELVLGSRFDARAARGDIPFYQLPFIDLRGIPKARYQDDNVGVAEFELRWNATRRWAYVGFFGAGKAWGAERFGEANTVYAGGVGLRYLIARRLGIYVGADVARGPEQTAFYIQVGSAWR
ncbi:hypothetical protein AYO46_09025 [Betaproteobacteria bacterium SCGC AG-212-J23]|nr:hypothetical protein AYO46_09025 [Betaproteobacteria bacterium SCGC AG-212-J23]